MTDMPKSQPPMPRQVNEIPSHEIEAARRNPTLPEGAQAALFRHYNYGGGYPGGEYFHGPQDAGRLREAIDRFERTDPRDRTYTYRSAVRGLNQTDWNGATQDRDLMIQQLRALQYRWQRQNEAMSPPRPPSNLTVPDNLFTPRP